MLITLTIAVVSFMFVKYQKIQHYLVLYSVALVLLIVITSLNFAVTDKISAFFEFIAFRGTIAKEGSLNILTPKIITYAYNYPQYAALKNSIFTLLPRNFSAPIANPRTRLLDIHCTSQFYKAEDSKSAGSGDQCTICMDKRPNCFYYPCGHSGICVECGMAIISSTKVCHICRTETLLVFRSQEDMKDEEIVKIASAHYPNVDSEQIQRVNSILLNQEQ